MLYMTGHPISVPVHSLHSYSVRWRDWRGVLPYWSAHHWVRYGRVRLLQRVGGGSLSYHKISHYSTQAADGNIYLALCGAWVKSAFMLYIHTAALVNEQFIVKCTYTL